MFMLEQAMHDKRQSPVEAFEDGFRDILQDESDSCSRFDPKFACLSLDALACCPEILELEDAAVVNRQILVRVPWAGPEALQAAVSLKSSTSRDVSWCVDFVGKQQVFTLGSLALSQVSTVSARSGLASVSSETAELTPAPLPRHRDPDGARSSANPAQFLPSPPHLQ